MGSLLCEVPAVQRPCSGGPCHVGTLLFKDSILGGSVVQGPCFRRLCYVWVPCAEGSWHAETLLLGESCVDPYSVKPCYIDTLFSRTLVYRKSAVWGPCCVGILP